jgi:uncharacterized metal-binding protein (TIGR02443 family)
MKRFIAGAVCPQCQGVDKIFVSEDAVGQYRQCVRCGFRDARPDDSDQDADTIDANVAGVVQMVGTHRRESLPANDRSHKDGNVSQGES